MARRRRSQVERESPENRQDEEAEAVVTLWGFENPEKACAPS